MRRSTILSVLVATVFSQAPASTPQAQGNWQPGDFGVVRWISRDLQPSRGLAVLGRDLRCLHRFGIGFRRRGVRRRLPVANIQTSRGCCSAAATIRGNHPGLPGLGRLRGSDVNHTTTLDLTNSLQPMSGVSARAVRVPTSAAAEGFCGGAPRGGLFHRFRGSRACRSSLLPTAPMEPPGSCSPSPGWMFRSATGGASSSKAATGGLRPNSTTTSRVSERSISPGCSSPAVSPGISECEVRKTRPRSRGASITLWIDEMSPTSALRNPNGVALRSSAAPR